MLQCVLLKTGIEEKSTNQSQRTSVPRLGGLSLISYVVSLGPCISEGQAWETPAIVLHRKEGFSQGCVFWMDLYAVELLPFAEGMRAAIPEAL